MNFFGHKVSLVSTSDDSSPQMNEVETTSTKVESLKLWRQYVVEHKRSQKEKTETRRAFIERFSNWVPPKPKYQPRPVINLPYEDIFSDPLAKPVMPKFDIFIR